MSLSEKQLRLDYFEARVHKSDIKGSQQLRNLLIGMTTIEAKRKELLLYIIESRILNIQRKERFNAATSWQFMKPKPKVPIQTKPKPNWMNSFKENVFRIFGKPRFEKNHQSQSKQQEEVALMNESSEKKSL